MHNKLILIGNPNVGKSVIFGQLTGAYATVSNYPGTTVEISQGTGLIGGKKAIVIDAPGTNSLVPSSEDEKVARDLLLEEKNAAIIQVADAKNLKRTLLLTVQLIETGLPLVLDINMIDELAQRRMKIDVLKLAGLLELPVASTLAIEGQGIAELKKKALLDQCSGFALNYGDRIEVALREIETLLPNSIIKSRAIGLIYFSNDPGIEKWLLTQYGEDKIAQLQKIRQELQDGFSKSLNQVIAEIRDRAATRIVNQVLTFEPSQTGLLQKIGNLTMRPLTGFPILFIILYLMYKFVGEFAAQTGVDFFEEILFGKYLNPWATSVVNFAIPFQLGREFLVGDYGIMTMALTYALAIVLPIVSAFFIFFSLLEDSGYLPRLAILLNRSFRLIGLSGKAVIPMVLGLGCDTMATMTTRTLETRRERIIATLLLALAIPCSAQLGVILGMIAGVSAKATLIWLGVVVLTLLLVGWLAARVLPGQSSDFILEIPPIRIPKLSNILVKTLARLEWYIKEAVPLFILGTVILFVLDKIAVLKIIEHLASPLVVNWLGLPAKATEAFLIGFLRRDYGAAGLFALAKAGQLDPIQIVVSLVTITLFVPCIAQAMVMAREHGVKVAFWITAFIFPFAFLVGGLLNLLLRGLGVAL